MPQTVTIDIKTARELVKVFRELKKEIVLLRAKIDEIPGYGTTKWWKVSTQKALEEFSKGQVHEAKDLKDALRFLHS